VPTLRKNCGMWEYETKVELKVVVFSFSQP
jgi:hypothetical protein